MHSRGLGFEPVQVEPGMLFFFCFYVVESFKEYQPIISLHLGGADFRSSDYFSNISKLNGRSDIYSQNTQNCELKELYMKLVKTGRSLESQNLENLSTFLSLKQAQSKQFEN